MEENFKIVHEGASWTVYERTVSGADSKVPGTVEWKARTFHATPEQACCSLMNRLLALELEAHELDLTGHLQEVLQAIGAARARVEAVAGNIKAGAL